MTNQDHVLELTAAYALGALPPEQALAVRAHCATCRACAEDLAEMTGLTATLPLACDQIAPPSALKQRILAEARGDASAGAFLRNPVRRSPSPWSSWWAAAAAAIFIAGTAIGTSAYIDHQRMAAQMAAMRDQLAANQVAITEIATGRVWDLGGGTKSHWWHCAVVQPPQQHKAMLVASMPPAPKGMTFQAWVIHRGKIHDVGTVSPGTTSMMHMPMPVQLGDVVAFTIEPMGGSETPTMPFVMRQQLD